MKNIEQTKRVEGMGERLWGIGGTKRIFFSSHASYSWRSLCSFVCCCVGSTRPKASSPEGKDKIVRRHLVNFVASSSTNKGNHKSMQEP